MIDGAAELARIAATKRPRRGQESRGNALGNAACDCLEPEAWREKVRPQYLKLYKKACRFNLEGELAEILERTKTLHAQGRVYNPGRYFLTAGNALMP
jgi:hypothetical protein